MGITVKKSVAWGGAIVLFLLLWSQMEGFLSDWIYKRTGFMDTKVQVERHVDSIIDERLKQQQEAFQKQTDELNRHIVDLQNQLRDSHPPKKRPRGAAGQ